MTEEEFDILLTENAPHPVLRKDWSRYYPHQFADAFLPKAGLIRGTALWVYDGAGLFPSVEKVKASTMPLGDDGKLIGLISFTYPEGAMAGLMRSRVQPAEDEMLTFMEVLQDDSAEVHYRWGNNFKQWLQKKDLRPNMLESKVYRFTINEIRKQYGL